MSRLLHIHHTNKVWHIPAALCAPQHISLEDFPPLGPPARLTCSSLHILPRPAVIPLFFWGRLAVRFTFDTLSVSARYRRWSPSQSQSMYRPKKAGLCPVPPLAPGSPAGLTQRSTGYVILGWTGVALLRGRFTARKHHYSYLKFLAGTLGLDRASALLRE